MAGFFESWDLFGTSNFLFFKKDVIYSSPIGGAASLFMTLLIGFFLMQMVMVPKRVYSSNTLPRPMDMTKPFMVP